jgi:hypothetical protein
MTIIHGITNYYFIISFIIFFKVTTVVYNFSYILFTPVSIEFTKPGKIVVVILHFFWSPSYFVTID